MVRLLRGLTIGAVARIVVLIGGSLVAYAWYLIIVGIVLPFFVRVVGADQSRQVVAGTRRSVPIAR